MKPVSREVSGAGAEGGRGSHDRALGRGLPLAEVMTVVCNVVECSRYGTHVAISWFHGRELAEAKAAGRATYRVAT